MRRTIIMLSAGLMCLTALPADAAAPKPVTVFEDAAGDAGNNGSPIPGSEQGGFDLTAGTIALNGKDLEFTVTHSAMPPVGSMPEAARFMWHFSAGKEQYRFTVKSLDVGKPDAAAGTGTERVGQVYTEGTYRLEQCEEQATPAITLVNCNVVEYLTGSFDPAAKAFTIVLPLSVIKGKPGMEIGGGTSGAASTNCQICWIPHYAERSLSPHTVIDYTAQAVTYKIPKK
ncbi:MAG TPA: hypothetical protein VNC78_12545 [Actinomycetota bacterium]|nr:hypothetical protein [Actinomycetota bacterium]